MKSESLLDGDVSVLDDFLERSLQVLQIVIYARELVGAQTGRCFGAAVALWVHGDPTDSAVPRNGNEAKVYFVLYLYDDR